MGLLAFIHRSHPRSPNGIGISARADRVCIVNVPGPFDPDDDTPAVRLIRRERVGNVVCVPIEAEGRSPMFGGCFIHTSDSRFSDAVALLSGYEFAFPVALHDRTE